MSTFKFKKGDTVQVTVGKDSGRQGRIERVLPTENLVLVPGLNEYKRHRKAQTQAQGGERAGEIVTLSRPLDVAKIAIVCPKCKRLTRVGFRLDGDKKVRICRKCQNDLDSIVKASEAKVKKVKAAKK